MRLGSWHLSTASNVVAHVRQRGISLFCLLFVLLPAFLLGQPKATIVGGLTFDFGTLYSSSKAKRLITIRNDGSDTLSV